MPVFITHGRYTAVAVKGMVEHPEDRAKAVADLFERAGGKLHGSVVIGGRCTINREGGAGTMHPLP